MQDSFPAARQAERSHILSINCLVAFGELAGRFRGLRTGPGAALQKGSLHCWYNQVTKPNVTFLNWNLVPIL